MVLEDPENDDQPSNSRLLPPAMSLILHGILAAILWLVVVQAKPRAYIRLTASRSASSSTTSLKLSQAVQPVERVVTDKDEPAISTDSTIADLLLEALSDNITDVSEEKNLEGKPEDNPSKIQGKSEEHHQEVPLLTIRIHLSVLVRPTKKLMKHVKKKNN